MTNWNINVTSGLDRKIRLMKDGGKWSNMNDHVSTNETDPSITEEPYDKDMLRFDIFMNAQNYKNYFAYDRSDNFSAYRG